MSKIKQIRLSSNNVMCDVDFISPRFNSKPRDRVKVYKFEYCVPSCKHADEHDYRFDGVVFYKKEGRL